MQTEGDLSPSSTVSGFTARFPNITIAPEDTFTIVLNEDFMEFYGEDFVADLVMFGSSDSSLTGSIGFSSNKINDIHELIILFKWDSETNQLIEDVDYFVWSSLDGIINVVNKTGIGNYLDDTAIDNQLYFETEALQYYSYSRIGIDEIDETQIDGNGISGNNETSENFRESWEIRPIINLGCTNQDAPTYDPDAIVDDGSCGYEYNLAFGERQDFGEIEYNLINEASGIVVSRKNKNVFWTHNDSGDANRIYAFNEAGQHLGVYYLNDCSARDWEDIAIGPGPDEGQDYIYVGEIGGNYSQYEIKRIFRFIEPNVESNQSPVNEILYDIDTILFQYPDGNRDAETLMLDPLTKDIIIVSKREEVIHIYNLPFPQNTTGVILVPELIHTMDFYPFYSNESFNIVAGDISRDGTEILVKSYRHIFYFPRYENQTIAEALTNTITHVEYIEEDQGEAVAWHQDGFGYFTLSEEVVNIPCHLYFYPRIIGCIDENAYNYNSYAIIDDGSCQYEFSFGDINGDGILDILDVIIIANLSLNDEYNQIVDFNEDGEINILDIVVSVNMILNP